MRRYLLKTYLALPADLYSGPPGKPGDIVELNEERCALFGRFLSREVRSGDMELLEDSAPAEVAAAAAREPTAPPGSATSTAPAALAAAAKE